MCQSLALSALKFDASLIHKSITRQVVLSHTDTPLKQKVWFYQGRVVRKAKSQTRIRSLAFISEFLTKCGAWQRSRSSAFIRRRFGPFFAGTSSRTSPASRWTIFGFSCLFALYIWHCLFLCHSRRFWGRRLNPFTSLYLG